MRCANEYWTQFSQDTDSRHNREHQGNDIKNERTLGPTQNRTAHLKYSNGEIITDKDQQMEIWVEHYGDLYYRQNTVSPAALDAIECLPTLQLRAVGTRTQQGHRQLGIRQGPRQWWDSPWLDQTLRLPYCSYCTKSCASVLLQEGAVAHDMRDSKIITLYKDNGERNDCSNFRGISLLGIVV